jgi:hypothetical protein
VAFTKVLIIYQIIRKKTIKFDKSGPEMSSVTEWICKRWLI